MEDNKNIEEAAQKIYGLEYEDFKKIILMPEAYRMNIGGADVSESGGFSKMAKMKPRPNTRVFIFSAIAMEKKITLNLAMA